MTSYKSIEEAIRYHSESNPKKVAVIDEKGNFISYGEFEANIQKAANGFQKLGIGGGERIILAASKSVDFLYLYFGAHLEGIITVPVDPEINPVRMARIVRSTTPTRIFGDLSHIKDYDVHPFSEVLEKGLDSITCNLPVSDQIADILFTTGTTGDPKGVSLTNANEYHAACNINEFIGNTSDDIELLALPISHSFGLGRVRCVMLKGATLVILGSFASMKKFYRAMDEYGVTGFGMVPASWQYITKMSGDRIADFSDQLKYIEIGSAAMPLNEKKRLMSLLPETKICMHYGLTEASRSAFISFSEEQSHLDTAGKASPNCEIAIFNEDGVHVGYGIEGEVCVKGDHVCADYWNNHVAYAEDFYQGYFRTGDWGFLDGDGYLHLKSRRKEMINVGGKKVSPMEVEEALETIDGISEAACVGMPDPVMGEVVRACVVAESEIDEQAIKDKLSSLLENYKIPVSIERIGSIPRTTSGKIQRLMLK